MFKSEFGKEAHISQLVTMGVEAVNGLRDLTKFDAYDRSKFDKYMLILEEYSNGIFRNHLIGKDCVASCFEILIKILGPKTDEAYS